MTRIVEHRETIELSTRDLELAVFAYLAKKMPEEYDEFMFTGLRYADHLGTPTQHMLVGINALKVTFSYSRKVD